MRLVVEHVDDFLIDVLGLLSDLALELLTILEVELEGNSAKGGDLNLVGDPAEGGDLLDELLGELLLLLQLLGVGHDSLAVRSDLLEDGLVVEELKVLDDVLLDLVLVLLLDALEDLSLIGLVLLVVPLELLGTAIEERESEIRHRYR